MFQPPALVESEVFASVPAGLRRVGQVDEWSRVNGGAPAAGCFLEGPCFDAAGNLHVVDIPFGRVLRFDPQGACTLVAEYDGWPNGLKIRPDGSMLIADYRNGLMALDPLTGQVTRLLGHRHSEHFKGLNDLVLAGNGDLYFTDQGQTGLHDPTGRVYRLTAAGRLDLLVGNVPSPNGIALNAAGTVLFVAATRGNNVWRLPLMADGSVSKVGCFVQLSGGVGPDGLAMARGDHLAVAHLGLGGVWLFDRRGLPLCFVRSCGSDLVTNIAFGGKDHDILYMTDSGTGSILRAKVPLPPV